MPEVNDELEAERLRIEKAINGTVTGVLVHDHYIEWRVRTKRR